MRLHPTNQSVVTIIHIIPRYIEEIARKFELSHLWDDFIQNVQDKDNMHLHISHFRHPAAHLLGCFHKSGTPRLISSDQWTPGKIKAAINQGLYSSSMKKIDFLHIKYADMVKKQQWIVLPAKMLENLFGLHLSPLGLVP